jgi:hypothetical protein
MFENGRIFLCFKGVDYRTEVYFNGQYLGGHEGFFAPFEFDVTSLAIKGTNTLVVKVYNEPTTTGSADGLGNHIVGDKFMLPGDLVMMNLKKDGIFVRLQWVFTRIAILNRAQHCTSKIFL